MDFPYLDDLNGAQRQAAIYGVDRAGGGRPGPPLLVIAGAGSGKTNTLAHRVAHLIVCGADPQRILLLTFTRRAAAEMVGRVGRIVQVALRGAAGNARRASGQAAGGPPSVPWAGTFHGIANRLLRLHAQELSLDPAFTVLDRSDAADSLEILRQELELAKGKRRFPQKGTCLAIYSRVVNAREPLAQALAETFPWCAEWEAELKTLFRAYAERKHRLHVLDYDDLLLCWHALMSAPDLAKRVRSRFDHLLVDEFQDTNGLQAEILRGLSPDGRGVTVVGDDAQAIYAFRAADVRNILDFPAQYRPPAEVVTLAENYRSTQPLLDAANAVIGLSAERFAKDLYSQRGSAQKPWLVQAFDEAAQADYVADAVLRHREEGIALKRQAVLVRAAHHSDLLEVELGRRNVPFVKYGGLRFLEAAHVKDFLCLLRLAENPRDEVAGFRVLQLLPGVGPAFARRAVDHLAANGFNLTALRTLLPPAAARQDYAALTSCLGELGAAAPWPAQTARARAYYQPVLAKLYDHPTVRALDLDALETLAGQYPSADRFLAEVTLDPPNATGDEAGPPLLDEDYLILSTIHSAKGQEWDAVFVLNATDGAIPTCRAGGNPAQIEEERRLLYVAMTRARDFLHLVHPLRYYPDKQPKRGDLHLYAPRSRFLPDGLLDLFERRTHGGGGVADAPSATLPPVAPIDVGQRLRDLWA